MKGTDLMIGDWVKWDNHYLQVQGTGEPDTYFGLDAISDIIPNDELEGIPLTEEILEANGFEYSRAESYDRSRFYRFPKDCALYKWSSFGVEHFVDGRCYKITDHVFIAIHYVHELQNTLRLCGLDDLANNFKIK